MSSSCVIGFHCSHEQFPPSVLLRNVTLAAKAGFTAAMCSDHFHPWTEQQGHSGFAWSWLGAALQATQLSFGTVCAPGQRYHPAVIAQAAATLSEMFPDRFWLALGSGEAVNEAITGSGWPSKGVRNGRLEQCVRVMRALWAGDTVSCEGHVSTHAAHLYSRPARPPLVLGAAVTPETARWVGGWADGLITVAGPRAAMRAVVEAFREGSGGDKPMFLQVALSFAGSEHEAAAEAYRQWPQAALTAQQLSDLSTPAEFNQACMDVDPLAVLSKVRASADIQRHIDWLREDCLLGFERIYLHNVAIEHQERFIDVCGEWVIPSLTHVIETEPERTGR